MQRPGAAEFYVTTTELRAQGSSAVGHEYRVNGTVVAGSIVKSGLRTAFTISDGKKTVAVVTNEPLPSAFKKGSDVVAQGRYDGRRFTASQVFAKCPSKFKPKA
jgi:cytochrome c-type biogenesis protein CcmE